MIEFISHEAFPDDPYIKELVFLSIDPKCRIAYVHKPMKNGGMFWSPLSCSVLKNQQKKYIDAIELDSNFLKKDILAFLEERSWEKNKPVSQSYAAPPHINHVSPPIQTQMNFLDECPF